MNFKNILMSFYEAKYPNIFFGISILIIKNKKMKKTNLLTAATLCLALGFTSCSKSDSIDCHECHIAYEGSNVEGEVEVPILAPDGSDDFCGSALEAVEAPGYTHTIEETIIGMDTIPAGTYSEIHCEEHADH
jgi:hypothetical protein